MEELDRYPLDRSSRHYRQSRPCLDGYRNGYCPSLEAEGKKLSSNIYDSFGKEVEEGRNPTLTGGGIIRSQGGWSQVVAMRGRSRKEEYDERIPGKQ